MDFKKEFEQRKEEINEILNKYLPRKEGLQRTVIDAMHYSVLSGGKRIRAILMLESYRLFGGKGEIIEPFLAAMEMIQSYSLVHDDLPALDNDEYRRGIKSTHAEYGEAMGILAGDALLNYAFELAAGAFEISCDERTARALQILGKKAGIFGMIGGQVVDVESEGKEIPFETLQFIHRNKCGALIEAAMMIGAVLAGASDAEVSKMEQIGADVGLAFQIRDDILDVTSSAEVLGKPIGSDEKNEKVTYVSFIGLEKAEEEVEKLSEHAVSTLVELPGKNDFLKKLILFMIHRKK